MFILCVLAAFSCVSLSTGLPDYRLPGDVIPQHYDLQILTHVDEANNFTFSGVVTIQLNVTNVTERIILHSKDLIIGEDNITVFILGDQRSISVVNVTYNTSLEFLILNLAESLKIGDHLEVTISFTGFLANGVSGFYKSSYINSENGQKVWLAASHFQETHARLAFPCLDEPAMKATFNITLGRRQSLTAISNMPLIKTYPIENMEGWVWDMFEKSHPMSTYLVAFVISDYKYVESPKYKNDVIIRTWTKPNTINQVEYAMKLIPKVLSFFEDYFGIKYPLPKLDMLSLPDMFYNAMENWGLITFKETTLLYSDMDSSNDNEDIIKNTITHEISHQWFGNLVTMKWWTDVWLNEGFATLMELFMYIYIEPDTHVLNKEITYSMMNVFKTDTLDSMHPVSVATEDPKELSQLFDHITYSKAAMILRMMYSFLGEDVFRTGITNYLNKYKYANADRDNLWQTLTEAAQESSSLPKDFTVKTIMDSWTKQIGYPLITVVRNYSNNTARVLQVRYQDKILKEQPKERWWVPLSYFSEDSNADLKRPKLRSWLSGEVNKTLSGMPSRDKWILFNVDMAGVYRVNYDEENWNLLAAALRKENHSGISELNRFQLITDSLALSSSGKLSYKITLKILQYLSLEKKYLPWEAAINSLSIISGVLRKFPDFYILQKFMLKLLAPEYDRIGGIKASLINGSSEMMNHYKQIINLACRMEMEDCTQNAAAIFKQWMNSDYPGAKNTIPKNLRETVYCSGVYMGGEEEWNFMWQRYKEDDLSTAKMSALHAMACTKDTKLLKRMLDESLSEKTLLRKEEVVSVFSSIAKSHVGYNIAKDFLLSRTYDIYGKLSPTFMKKFAAVIPKMVKSEEDIKEFQTWAIENREALQETTMTVKYALEQASILMEWITNQKDVFLQVLRDLA